MNVYEDQLTEIFEDPLTPSSKQYLVTSHLIFLQHGILGTHKDWDTFISGEASTRSDQSDDDYYTFDIRLGSDRRNTSSRHEIIMRNPELNYIALKACEGQTTASIAKQSKLCQHEIENNIFTIWNDMCRKLQNICRRVLISMVGHSLGGLVLRGALREIWTDEKSIVNRLLKSGELSLANFISLATPHAGIPSSFTPVRWISTAAAGVLVDFEVLKDLLLQSGYLTDTLCDESSFNVMVLFKRRLLFGNYSGDYLVSSKSSLLLFDDEDKYVNHFINKKFSDKSELLRYFLSGKQVCSDKIKSEPLSSNHSQDPKIIQIIDDDKRSLKVFSIHNHLDVFHSPKSKSYDERDSSETVKKPDHSICLSLGGRLVWERYLCCFTRSFETHAKIAAIRSSSHAHIEALRRLFQDTR